MGLFRKIRTLVRLSWDDRLLVLFAIPLLLAVRIAVWTVSFVSVRRFVESCSTACFLKGRLAEGQIAWATQLAARYVPLANCLPQAIAAQIMLTWAGHNTRLLIGVRKQSGFEAHAWIESGGRILLGGADSKTYTPTLVFDRQ